MVLGHKALKDKEILPVSFVGAILPVSFVGAFVQFAGYCLAGSMVM